MKTAFNLNMNQKGYIELVTGVILIVVIGSLLIGAYESNKISGMATVAQNVAKEQSYLGDVKTGFYYDYQCLSSLEDKTIYIFKSRQEAENYNFKYFPLCPK